MEIKWINKDESLPGLRKRVLWWNKWTGIEVGYLAKGMSEGSYDVVTETEGDYAASLCHFTHWYDVKSPEKYE